MLKSARMLRLATILALVHPLTEAATTTAIHDSQNLVATQQPSAPTAELDEVRVYGRHLYERITAAEDRFFALYNQLNGDDRYRMSCGYRSLDGGSLIMTRVCIPGFLVDNLTLSSIIGGNCSGELGFSSGRGFTAYVCDSGGYEPPPAGLYLMERKSELHRHMMSVVKSDPRLHAMADHLGGLHMELQSAQQRIVKITSVKRRPTHFHSGPRT